MLRQLINHLIAMALLLLGAGLVPGYITYYSVLLVTSVKDLYEMDPSRDRHRLSWLLAFYRLLGLALLALSQISWLLAHSLDAFSSLGALALLALWHLWRFGAYVHPCFTECYAPMRNINRNKELLYKTTLRNSTR